ncbi:MAG: ABC transporter ATP-binding protein [gamma proteobacterium symbiont of Lucinoma myriamae]|nr:ABC transporter ATP-binding protein [gamma proteobacterium symbiont of Lucinoma myriamae]MCU7832998.1 ABC transporter ATP-binding protein [gamma proteobacterium symbiont of Lucinoma myriamae]
MTPLQIKLKNLSKNYLEGGQQHIILDDINVTFDEGEVIALVGPSGSGKTTLLNLISGIDEPDSGEVFVSGHNDFLSISAMNDEQKTLFRRHSIGFIFQFFNLIPTLTVLENIQFPLELCDKFDSSSANKISDLLQRLSIENKQHQYPEYLSGGEQQRVAIARAIIHQPQILLADEPTGNLDHETGRQVINVLLELAKEYQMTMLIVTHSQDVASRADRILSLKSGHLVEKTSCGKGISKNAAQKK